MTTTTAAARVAVPSAGPGAPHPTAGDISRPAARWSLALVLAGVLVLYTWDLAASGYANPFYSAAAQAGSVSWKAFFFGSLDAGNSITVDKTPASLWLMGLSVRLFGLSSWSILVPQALLGVGSAAVVFASVRRSLTGRLSESWQVTPLRAHVAGLVAALTMALTPSATLMFRYNNPDALLVFCYVVAAYCTVCATEAASRRWLALAGVTIGIGFLAKMLQAFVILPSLALAYVVAAPATWRKKLADLLVAFVAMAISCGWYVAVVELAPRSWRPYMGGSPTNSLLELTFGYNGVDRLTGNEVHSAAPGAPRGLLGMFTSQSGEMVSFLIPAALVTAGIALVVLGRAAYSNVLRKGSTTGETLALGAMTLYGSWLLINGLVFSFMEGIYHDYYTIALAPAIAGTVAVGGTILWAARARLAARVGLAAAALTTALWTAFLAAIAGGIYMGVALVGVVLLVGGAGVVLRNGHPAVVVSRATAWALAVGALLLPTSYCIDTASTPHRGTVVTAGPVNLRPLSSDARVQTLVLGTTPSSELVTLLRTDASSYTWVAATVGGQNAAGFQLAAGSPVMAVGGFRGDDPSPSLQRFQTLVAQHRIHYYIPAPSLSGQAPGAAAIESWVTSTFAARTVGELTVYDLTMGK